MLKVKRILFLLLILSVLSCISDAQEEKSKSLSDNPTRLTKYVVDETGTLTQEETNSLLKKLQEFDKQTSTQIVVYMIQSLGGEPIEEVSIRIAEENKIGRKGKDNGVLLLIAKGDRKLRIEVGYGLEGVLTDALSNQIIRNEITPEFKKNNYYAGINRGIDAIIAVTKGEYTADKDSGSDGLFAPFCLGMPIFVMIIFGIIFFSIFVSIIRSIFGLGGRTYTGKKGSSWSSGGGFWSGGGGSSGSSFGGFSGGGGSFGGGGSSGSW